MRGKTNSEADLRVMLRTLGKAKRLAEANRWSVLNYFLELSLMELVRIAGLGPEPDPRASSNLIRFCPRRIRKLT
jgi:hypothetical protein